MDKMCGNSCLHRPCKGLMYKNGQVFIEPPVSDDMNKFSFQILFYDTYVNGTLLIVIDSYLVE